MCASSPEARANFGLVAKYVRGSSTPTGNTEFQFQAGGLNFKSSSYDDGSLVISGPLAQYKGTGTINGQARYNFIATLADGSKTGGANGDGFRIKIWDATGVVYDNMTGSNDDLTALNTQGLVGGSVTIHQK